jgi:hypothetical protein
MLTGTMPFNFGFLHLNLEQFMSVLLPYYFYLLLCFKTHEGTIHNLVPGAMQKLRSGIMQWEDRRHAHPLPRHHAFPIGFKNAPESIDVHGCY